MVAPRSIWDAEWRDRFLGEAILKMNEDAKECLKTNLGKELMERSDIRESDWVANRIIDGNDPENQGLNELDEDTELDYALLSHWLWSGFGDAAETNDLLGKLIVGTATGPTLISSVAEDPVAGTKCWCRKR